jgi:hypothetical protein
MSSPPSPPSPVEQAVDTYIRVASERDAAKRAEMLEACWAEDGRLVVHGGRAIEGRAAMRAMYERFFADPKIAGVQVRACDARGTTFRFRYETDYIDGTTTEAFDVGEIDADGRIKLLIVFAGG